MNDATFSDALSALSMDSKRGRDLYRFDMSLMERLSSSGLAMSQIDVQRRMRPSISNLIRCVRVSTYTLEGVLIFDQTHALP
jgi:hypothetical protein